MPEFFPPVQAKQAEFNPAKVFSGVTAENSAAKFSEITKNSTFANLRNIVSEVDKFNPTTQPGIDFKKQVLEYVLPFRIALEAETDSKLSQKDFTKKYGEYGNGNDCYTYIMKLITANSKGITTKVYTNEDTPPPFYSIAEHDKSVAKAIKDKKDPPPIWVIQKPYEKHKDIMITLVPGDYIRADKSPLGKHEHNHWGIFIPADEKHPEARVIVNRGNEAGIMKLNEFLKFTDTFTVRRIYGGADYQQFIQESGDKKTGEYEMKVETKTEFTNSKQGPLPEGLMKK